MAAGLSAATAGLPGATVLPEIAGLLVAAVAIGAGTGLATPIAFAHLAASTPKARLGRTMEAAEVGRELGDSGGPLLVGALAAAGSLTVRAGWAGGFVVAVGITARRQAHRSPTRS